MYNKGDVTDEYLVRGLKDQSHEVFELVFKTYYSSLYRLAYAYLMSKSLAEDMVQDVFVSLWCARASLSVDTSLKSYLYSSVKHGCLDYIKHLQVIDSNKEKLAEALIFSGTVEYEDSQALLDEVKQCMQRLPEQQRKVLELKVFHKMNYKEIAQEMHISEMSVHTHVKRAYKYLRDSVSFKVLMILFW